MLYYDNNVYVWYFIVFIKSQTHNCDWNEAKYPGQKMLAEKKKKMRLPLDPNNKNWTEGKREF